MKEVASEKDQVDLVHAMSCRMIEVVPVKLDRQNLRRA